MSQSSKSGGKALRRFAVVFVVLAFVASATIVPGVAGAPVAPVVEGDFGESQGTNSVATFAVTDTGVPDQAAIGEQFDVSTRIVNRGSLSGLQAVTFRLDLNGDGVAAADEVVGDLAVALPAGGARVVSIPAEVPTDLAPGEYRYALVTADETIEGTLTVGEAANYGLAVDAPSAAVQGDSLTIETSVTNRGDLNGTTPVTFSFDANGDGSFDTNETTTLNRTIAGGATTSVPFELNISDDLAPGDYRYRVSADGAIRSGTLAVELPPPEFSVPSVRGPSAVSTTGNVQVMAIVKNDENERRTGEVGVYLDLNGDGEYTADEQVRSRSVELGPGSSTLHSFSVALPSDFSAGNTYSYAVMTDFDSHEESFEVYRPTSSSKPENPQKPYRGEPWQLPGIIQLEDYDLGGEGIAFHEVEPRGEEHFGGAYRTNESVDIEDLNDAPDDYTIGYTRDGEWLEYTVDIEPGTYDIVIPVASNKEPKGDGPRNVTVSLDGEELGAVEVPVTGGWDTYQTQVIEDVTISGGEGVVRVELGGWFIILDYVEFKKVSES